MSSSFANMLSLLQKETYKFKNQLLYIQDFCYLFASIKMSFLLTVSPVHGLDV